MNIQSLPWLKFGHDDYLASEFKAKANAFAKAAYLDLLCFAMKQRPALSIPNDDNVLAGWASVTIEFWQQIKDLVLSQFSLNQDDNRYYSPMLVELYSETEQSKGTETPAEPKRKAMTNAERVRKHREQKALHEAHVTPPVTENVTASNATCNDVTEAVTPCNAQTVTFGGTKGGDLDLRLEKENKELVVVVREAAQQNPLPTTTTKFSMFFDFQLQSANVDLLIDKLKVDPAKNTDDNLNNFIAHYLGSAFKNTQADWELHYVRWLKREKDKPVATTKTTAPLVIVDVKPLWETLAENKAQRAATPPKDAKSLALGESAFSEMKKKLGLKAA